MITDYSGLPGAGKTLSMTIDAFKLWQDTKLPVYANYNIRFPTGQFKKSYPRGIELNKTYTKNSIYDEPIYYYPKIIYGEDFLEAFKQVDKAIFLIDEAGTVFDNRSWRKFPQWLMARFRESRKSGLNIMYTAQDIGDVDIKLRKLTNYYVICKFEKFLNWDIVLRNWCFHSPVIKTDTPQMRKQWQFYYIAEWFWSFKKYYKLYNTYERITYQIPEGKEFDKLLKENRYETGEWGG